MKKCYKEIAKEKLNLHKTRGTHSNLSVFEAAQLFDVLTGKSNANLIKPDFLLEGINLN